MHDEQSPKPIVTMASPATKPVGPLAGTDTGYYSDPAYESPGAQGMGAHAKRLKGQETSVLVTRRDSDGYGYFE